MNQHYIVKTIMPGVWNIEDCPGGKDPKVNMYLLEGREKALLIDAGVSRGDLKTLVISLTNKPVELFITHGHGDHAAAISNFDKVYMSHKDIYTLKSLFPDIVFDEKKIIDINGGEIIDIGGIKIEVIALPGHTKGSMVLLDRKRKLLFTGDSIGSGTIWMQLGHSSSLQAFLKEIVKFQNKIKDLGDLKYFVGHESQLKQEITKEYISDLRIITEKVIKGEVVGEEVDYNDPLTKGLSASYGQMLGLIYKANNIFEK